MKNKIKRALSGISKKSAASAGGKMPPIKAVQRTFIASSNENVPVLTGQAPQTVPVQVSSHVLTAINGSKPAEGQIFHASTEVGDAQCCFRSGVANSAPQTAQPASRFDGGLATEIIRQAAIATAINSGRAGSTEHANLHKADRASSGQVISSRPTFSPSGTYYTPFASAPGFSGSSLHNTGNTSSAIASSMAIDQFANILAAAGNAPANAAAARIAAAIDAAAAAKAAEAARAASDAAQEYTSAFCSSDSEPHVAMAGTPQIPQSPKTHTAHVASPALSQAAPAVSTSCSPSFSPKLTVKIGPFLEHLREKELKAGTSAAMAIASVGAPSFSAEPVSSAAAVSDPHPTAARKPSVFTAAKRYILEHPINLPEIKLPAWALKPVFLNVGAYVASFKKLMAARISIEKIKELIGMPGDLLKKAIHKFHLTAASGRKSSGGFNLSRSWGYIAYTACLFGALFIYNAFNPLQLTAPLAQEVQQVSNYVVLPSPDYSIIESKFPVTPDLLPMAQADLAPSATSALTTPSAQALSEQIDPMSTMAAKAAILEPDSDQYMDTLRTLAACIYLEAGPGMTIQSGTAVGWVIRNRSESSIWNYQDIVGQIYRAHQFSVVGAPGTDRRVYFESLKSKILDMDSKGADNARICAQLVLDGDPNYQLPAHVMYFHGEETRRIWSSHVFYDEIGGNAFFSDRRALQLTREEIGG